MEQTSILSKKLANFTIIFQLMGLQYFKLGGVKRETFAQRHKFNVGVIFVLLSLAIFGASYVFVVLNKDEQSENVETSLIFEHISVILIISTISFSMLHSFLMSSKAHRIFKSFEKVAEIFSSDLSHNLDYSAVVKEFKIFFCFTISSFVIISFVFSVMIYETSAADYFLSALFGIFPYFFLEICVVRFIFYVILIKFHVMSIEKVLLRFRESNELMTINVRDNNCWDFRSKPLQSVESIANVEFVLSLKKVYGIVFKATEKTNHVCGFVNVVLLGLIVSANINGGYGLYLWRMNEIPFDQILGLLIKKINSNHLIKTFLFLSSSLHDVNFDYRIGQHDLLMHRRLQNGNEELIKLFFIFQTISDGANRHFN